MFYLSTLIELLRQPEFKVAFLKMKQPRFLPEGNKGGAAFDCFTCFGLFMRLSILGQRVSGHIYQEALAVKQF